MERVMDYSAKIKKHGRIFPTTLFDFIKLLIAASLLMNTQFFQHFGYFGGGFIKFGVKNVMPFPLPTASWSQQNTRFK